MQSFARFSSACFLATMFLFSCKNEPKSQAVDQPPKPDTIVVAPVSKTGASTFAVTAGTINWAGKKSIGGGHNGTINVEKGELLVNQNTIIDGTFSLDMNSIAVSDIKDAGERRDLESHLKDNDFFETEKFPKAEFVITEVLPSNNPAFNWLIVGNLTMKGKTNPVNIPVKLTFDGDNLKAESPSFPINRTQWGVNFHSGILGTTKDKLIDDNVLLSLTLQAKKG
jgi:polyisoprenoid-binding protein YceI